MFADFLISQAISTLTYFLSQKDTKRIRTFKKDLRRLRDALNALSLD